MTNINGVKLNVLLADDDPDDRMFFADAIESLPVKINLIAVKDGVKLMEHLHAEGVILPDMVFLDLNMPFKNGFQCLSEIRNDPGLKKIFIAIYST